MSICWFSGPLCDFTYFLMDQLAYILGSTKWKCWDTLKPICLLRYVVSVICALLVVLRFRVVIFMFTQMFMFMSRVQCKRHGQVHAQRVCQERLASQK